MSEPLSDPYKMPPHVFTEAERQAHREAGIMARVQAIEDRELQVPSHADEEKLFLTNLARELYAKVLAQRASIALAEQGQGILGQEEKVYLGVHRPKDKVPDSSACVLLCFADGLWERGYYDGAWRLADGIILSTGDEPVLWSNMPPTP